MKKLKLRFYIIIGIIIILLLVLVIKKNSIKNENIRNPYKVVSMTEEDVIKRYFLEIKNSIQTKNISKFISYIDSTDTKYFSYGSRRCF